MPALPLPQHRPLLAAALLMLVLLSSSALAFLGRAALNTGAAGSRLAARRSKCFLYMYVFVCVGTTRRAWS